MTPRVALVTYSTKPRGGVVHTLALAEALTALGTDVTVVALGDAGAEHGFFRPTSARHVLVPAPAPADTLEGRVFSSVDALASGLSELAGEFDIVHTQDCISARAAVRAREAGAEVAVLRTVHHIDDFTTAALMDCQRQAILEPDRVLVVSDYWRRLLDESYGVVATVVHNGVDASRFGPISREQRATFRAAIGAGNRFVFLAVGGIEPRKGSIYLLEAMGRLKARAAPGPVLAVVGGHSFQDYAAYRSAALGRLPELGLTLGVDVVLLGTLPDAELAAWYRSADALAFPSLKEGWGLVVLEAMSADLPVVATDIEVFREYLSDGDNALLVPPAEGAALADAMAALMTGADLRRRLCAGGHRVVERFTWAAAARRHQSIYHEVAVQNASMLRNGLKG